MAASRGFEDFVSARGQALQRFAYSLAVADIGQIGSPVQVTSLNVGNRNTLASPADVGVPGSPGSQVPQLARPAAIHAPAGFTTENELTGQGMSGTGLSGSGGRLAIVARCSGPGQLRLTFGTGAAERQLGTIRCDSAVHELTTAVRLRPHDAHAGVTVYASDRTSYRVMIGTVR
ncbi:MAG TPA: hypothetical protein VFW16_12215 [Streptosporangiaceae bacterium]|nr:hypothetical protein [Streptosporangiaceae bacterium]